MSNRSTAEKILFDYADLSKNPSPVFIIGSPRTGSTILYQALVNSFSFPYFSNFVNDYFSQDPIVGMAIQHSIDIDIAFENSFGKTVGDFQPSEGSAILTKWFGGGHPSQELSARILEGQENHFLNTLVTVEALFEGRHLLIKNAWNCFRIKYLASVLRDARFIWIRRDIADAAESDLEARYVTKGSGFEWNSATPSKWCELTLRPPYEQVVENQFEFNKIIAHSLKQHASRRSIEIWYEDFISSTDNELHRISEFINIPSINKLLPLLQHKRPRQRQVSKQESASILSYLDKHNDRFASYRYRKQECF